jgi:hypothetical protein
MRKVTNVTAFGSEYRIRQYSAVDGFEFMTKMESESPEILLKDTSIKVGAKKWVLLDNKESINEYVKDVLNIVDGHEAISKIISFVIEFNFDFLDHWKATEIPSRLCAPIDDKDQIEFSDNPVMAQLIANKIATMKELEEYYSLEDAFRMYDIYVEDSLNKALASEASYKESAENNKRRS